MSYLIFGGVPSYQVGVVVEHCPSYQAPQRVVTKYTIPGRSGDLTLDTGAYSNVTQTYEVWYKHHGLNMTEATHAVAKWLLSAQGYQRLEDTYDPDIYRMALFVGPVDFENWMLRRGRATLTFDCQPQRWYKSGELPVTLTSGSVLHNPGQPSSPLLHVTGNGDGELSVGDTIIHISGLDGDMMIDCDSQNAYWEAENLNANIQVSQFPVLSAGDTAISWSGGITGVICIPRWWTL